MKISKKTPARRRTSRAAAAVALGALAAASPVLAGGTQSQAVSEATGPAGQNFRALDHLSTEAPQGLVPLTDPQLAHVEGTNHPLPAQAWYGQTIAAAHRPQLPEQPGIHPNHNETLLRDAG